MTGSSLIPVYWFEGDFHCLVHSAKTDVSCCTVVLLTINSRSKTHRNPYLCGAAILFL